MYRNISRNVPFSVSNPFLRSATNTRPAQQADMNLSTRPKLMLVYP